MRYFLALLAIVFFNLAGNSAAQAVAPPAVALPSELLAPEDSAFMQSMLESVLPTDEALPPQLTQPAGILPLMSPELALQTYASRSARQTSDLSSYTTTTVIHAELPETKQQGEYEVKRQYSAPKSLLFTALRFTGDTFVKSNVILRLMQSEVDHVQKDEGRLVAISDANYKFSYKGLREMEGRPVHLYQLKPRKKRLGLIKGTMSLDARTGSLVRLEGIPAKSPSVFLSKIKLEQDYADFGPFTLPVHVHSEAKASVVGKTIVDVYHRDYQVVPNAMPMVTSAGQ
jgi:hypothetical protein